MMRLEKVKATLSDRRNAALDCPPLLMFVVGTMISQHHLQSRRTQQGHEQSRPDVVHLHQAGPPHRAHQRAQEGMHQRLHPFHLARRQVNESHTGIGCCTCRLCHIRPSAEHGYLEPFGKTGIEVLTMLLYPSLYAGKPSCAKDEYLHSEIKSRYLFRLFEMQR